MKATGIVRRIDDLGRVVIPKEIRRTMRIREGDPLEIFVSNDGEVIFKKYSPISELGSIAAQYCEVLYRTGFSGAHHRSGPCGSGQRHQSAGGAGASGVSRLGGSDREPQELFGW